MRRWLRFLLVIFCLTLICSAHGISTFADENTDLPPSVAEASAVYLVHMESNTTVFQKNATQTVNAGSTVKVMAGLLACEELADRLQEQVPITNEMVNGSAGYRLYIKAGDTLRVEQLLYAAICASYNDAYDILAAYIAGSKEAFVERMNARAAELGCDHTFFSDASGVDDTSHTDADDLFRIAKHAYENELYMEVCSTVRYAFPGSQKLEARTFYNRNALVSKATTEKYYNAKCKGMSAGYTERGGSCVVTAARKGTDTYLCIVMGAPETEETTYGYVVANRLLSWCFDAFAYQTVLTPEDAVCILPVTVSDTVREIELRVAEPFSCFLPVSAEIGTDITFSIRLDSPTLEAPVSEGTQVGYVAILYRGQQVEILPLYTAGSADRSTFIGGIKSLQALTKNRAFMAGLIFFLVSILIWAITEALLKRQRRLKWDKYFSMKMNPSPSSLQSKPDQKKTLK